MKILLISLLTAISFELSAQVQITDERDGSTYHIFELGNLLWFKDNLKFKTPTSWCSENPKSDACKIGNYYYSTDLINVCPSGWRVPTWREYKKAIKRIEDYYELADSIQYLSVKLPLYKDLHLDAERIVNVTLINDTTFFDMAATGWIEGDKWIPQNNTNLWIIHEISNTPQPHVHISPNEIIMHSHGHHVIDEPNKLRRFTVRCVSDIKPGND